MAFFHFCGTCLVLHTCSNSIRHAVNHCFTTIVQKFSHNPVIFCGPLVLQFALPTSSLLTSDVSLRERSSKSTSASSITALCTFNTFCKCHLYHDNFILAYCSGWLGSCSILSTDTTLLYTHQVLHPSSSCIEPTLPVMPSSCPLPHCSSYHPATSPHYFSLTFSLSCTIL